MLRLRIPAFSKMLTNSVRGGTAQTYITNVAIRSTGTLLPRWNAFYFPKIEKKELQSILHLHKCELSNILHLYKCELSNSVMPCAPHSLGCMFFIVGMCEGDMYREAINTSHNV